MRETEINMEIQHISKKISRHISQTSLFKVTSTLQKMTDQANEKWDLTSKVENGLSDFFEKKLKEHTLLEKRNKNLEIADHFRKEEIDYFGRKKRVNNIIDKATLVSSVQGGGAALAGAPFTLVETFVMMNTLWTKMEQIALSFDIEPYSYFEKVYLLRILTIALADDKENRILLYKQMAKDEHLLSDDITLLQQFDYIDSKIVSQNCASYVLAPLVYLKLSQTVPIIGFAIGSFTNGSVLKKCLRFAGLMYGRRYLDQLKTND